GASKALLEYSIYPDQKEIKEAVEDYLHTNNNELFRTAKTYILQEDIEVAAFLDVIQPESVFIIRSALEAFTIDYGNLQMQQQIQSFLEDYFEKPEESNIGRNQKVEVSTSRGNGTTPLKEKDRIQERNKAENLCYDSFNAKHITSTEAQEVQIPTTESKKKEHIKKAGSKHLILYKSGKENEQSTRLDLLYVVGVTNMSSVNKQQSRSSRNTSQKNQHNLTEHKEANGKSMLNLLGDIMKRLEAIENNQKGAPCPSRS
ncbi:4006_t:CDS:2, partial [Gigaspora rosea]